MTGAVNPAGTGGNAGTGAGAQAGVQAGLCVSYLLGTTAGGTGRHVAMLARGCAARGAMVRVYGPAAAGPWLALDGGPPPSRGGAADPAAAASRPTPGGPARWLSHAGSAMPGPGWDFSTVAIAGRPRPARDAAAVLRLRRLLARDTPDVLHAHGLRAGALAALALAVPGTPRTALVVTVHNAPPARGPAAALYAGLEVIVARRADAVLTVSGDLDARMRRKGARLAGRALVPAPARPRSHPPRWRSCAVNSGGVRPGSVNGQAVRYRAGSPVAGRSCSRSAGWPPRRDLARSSAPPRGGSRAERFRCCLSREKGRWMRSFAARPALAGVAVRFLGQRRDVPVLLAAADVVVVPSIWEGQPLIVQEALRAGRPLVATRVGGIAELTGDDGALLVQPGDPAGLGAAVTLLLDDPEAAARLAAAARARAALLPTETAAVDQALGLYHRVR